MMPRRTSHAHHTSHRAGPQDRPCTGVRPGVSCRAAPGRSLTPGVARDARVTAVRVCLDVAGRSARPFGGERGGHRMNIVEASGLGKRYGRTWALRECTLEVPAGQVTALVGPNGAGKTTLLNLAVGLAAPSA